MGLPGQRQPFDGGKQGGIDPGAPYRYDTGPKQSHLNLQDSEQTVTLAAAQVFSGYVIAQQVTKENEREMVEKAVEVAIQIAQRVDRRVRDKQEMES